jgi:hypothetical protein
MVHECFLTVLNEFAAPDTAIDVVSARFGCGLLTEQKGDNRTK